MNYIYLFLFLSSCALYTPKPSSVYFRPDVHEKDKKVLIFPTSDFNGNFSEATEEIDETIMFKWASMYGATNVIPASKIIDKVFSYMGKSAYSLLIASLDETSAQEQLGRNSVFRKGMKVLLDNMGPVNIGISILEGNESSYKNGGIVRIHIGLFDTEKLTWVWITKIHTRKKLIGEWKSTYGLMLNSSFSAIEKESKALSTTPKAKDKKRSTNEKYKKEDEASYRPEKRKKTRKPIKAKKRKLVPSSSNLYTAIPLIGFDNFSARAQIGFSFGYLNAATSSLNYQDEYTQTINALEEKINLVQPLTRNRLSLEAEFYNINSDLNINYGDSNVTDTEDEIKKQSFNFKLNKYIKAGIGGSLIFKASETSNSSSDLMYGARLFYIKGALNLQLSYIQGESELSIYSEPSNIEFRASYINRKAGVSAFIRQNQNSRYGENFYADTLSLGLDSYIYASVGALTISYRYDPLIYSKFSSRNYLSLSKHNFALGVERNFSALGFYAKVDLSISPEDSVAYDEKTYATSIVTTPILGASFTM